MFSDRERSMEYANERARIRTWEHEGEYWDKRRCPRCGQGFLDPWTGVCNNCGYY